MALVHILNQAVYVGLVVLCRYEKPCFSAGVLFHRFLCCFFKPTPFTHRGRTVERAWCSFPVYSCLPTKHVCYALYYVLLPSASRPQLLMTSMPYLLDPPTFRDILSYVSSEPRLSISSSH
ncbi:hypothetical protein V2G26_007067 [Clonostachys chloroleuca]